ncbi:hypothetical protein BTZ20_5635 [Rhodococcus sp. MTM3W5.2]|nr:hypothetical protein BTZ20_5635 [Rhodococcus sp. MTM3W5.2]
MRKTVRGPFGVEDGAEVATMPVDTAREWDERYWHARP